MKSRHVRSNMTASESDMSGMRRLSELSSKQADEALKSYSSHATKLADTSNDTYFMRYFSNTIDIARC